MSWHGNVQVACQFACRWNIEGCENLVSYTFKSSVHKTMQKQKLNYE